MRDLALDPATGDLAIADGRLRLTEPGPESIGQRLRIRLRFVQGEWHLDRRVGIPLYTDVFGKRPRAVVEALYRRVILTSPGVTGLDRYALTVGGDRRARLDFVARAGDVRVPIENFIAGVG